VKKEYTSAADEPNATRMPMPKSAPTKMLCRPLNETATLCAPDRFVFELLILIVGAWINNPSSVSCLRAARSAQGLSLQSDEYVRVSRQIPGRPLQACVQRRQ